MAYSVLGVDVSHWTRVVDFSKIPDTVAFVGAKATQGVSQCDPTLSSHRDGFRKKGFDLVVYYHYAAGDDPVKEAANFLKNIGPLQPNERLALDVEGSNPVGLPWIQSFINCLPKDRKHIAYLGSNTWNAIGNPEWPDATVGNVDLWTARYSDREPELPDPWSFWTFWQFSQSFPVAGISGGCDASYFFKDRAALKAYAQLKTSL